MKNVLRVGFKFELAVPKDKASIPTANFDSDHPDDEEDEDIENEHENDDSFSQNNDTNNDKELD